MYNQFDSKHLAICPTDRPSFGIAKL